jgi:acyl-CoA dehydrogenase
VRVPLEQRLGEEGRGWEVTVSALANERSSIAEVVELERRLEDLKELAHACGKAGRPVLRDPEVRRRLARFETRIQGMKLNGLRFLAQQIQGKQLSSETSINKLQRAILDVEMGDVALELLGMAGPYVGEASVERGKWQATALRWPATVIGGGTPNIQKNIIAERILGLPKD